MLVVLKKARGSLSSPALRDSVAAARRLGLCSKIIAHKRHRCQGLRSRRTAYLRCKGKVDTQACASCRLGGNLPGDRAAIGRSVFPVVIRSAMILPVGGPNTMPFLKCPAAT